MSDINNDPQDLGALFDDELPQDTPVVPDDVPFFDDEPSFYFDEPPADLDDNLADSLHIPTDMLGEDGPPMFDEEYLPDRTAEFTPAPGRRKKKIEDPELAAKVADTVRACFATCHGRPGEEVKDLVLYVLGSERAMELLSDQQRRDFKNVGQVFTAIAFDNLDEEFDLFDLPDLEAAHPRVVTEVNKLRALQSVGELPKNPTSTWRALCDHVQKASAALGAKMLLAAIENGAPADELMKIYTELEPPTTQRSVQNAKFSQSAGAWQLQDAEAEASRPLYRISSGYRTWDYVFTLKDKFGKPAEPLGCWAPGEFHAVAAGTGHGKSALSRRLITAAAEDLVHGWGHEHAKVLIAITEEAPKIVYQAAGLAAGQPFHHLKDHVIIADVGASRRRFVQAVWDCVIDAYHLAKATGQSIVDCGLPEFIVLDYIGGIVEAGEGGDTTAIENTANLIMRGLCGWRIQEMEQFSGESFAEYAGMSWPTGMENFKPAVLTFVQLKKLQKREFYDPNAKDCSIADYSVENADGRPGWAVRPGDFLVPTRSDVRGSGVLANHLTSLSAAHRSRPQSNNKIVDPVTKQIRLEDDRGRIIFLKTRNSSDTPFVPMRFDSNPEGLRGQYYDLLAERAITAGKIKTLASYTQAGDPILPPRPHKSPFDGVSY